MARTGVIYTDIAEAAAQLEGRGQSITVDSIRHLLGTGSRTTIANHLKAWKSQQTNADISGIPQELAAMLKGLWERLQAIADVRVKEIEQASIEGVGQIQHSLEQERRDSTALRAKIKEIETRNQDLKKNKDMLKEELDTFKHGKVKLETHLEKMKEQLEGQKKDNSNLHKINSRIQDNLEYAQKELIKLKKESDLTLEKYRQTLTAENQQLTQTLQDKIHRNHQLELELKHNNTVSIELKAQVKSLQEIHTADKAKLQDSTLALRHLQSQFDTLGRDAIIMKQELKEHTTIKHDLEKNNAVISDQLIRLENRLEHAEVNIKLLNAENFKPKQEKENMLGQIKRLQKAELIES